MRLPQWRRYTVAYAVRSQHLSYPMTLAQGAWFRRAWSADRAIARVKRELERQYLGRRVEVSAWVWRG